MMLSFSLETILVEARALLVTPNKQNVHKLKKGELLLIRLKFI